MGPDGQHRIQKQNPLSGPFFQITVVWDRTAQVIVKLLVNVHQGRGHRHIRLHGEAETVGLAYIVVGVLAQNHHLHLGKRGECKGIEYVIVSYSCFTVS